MLDYRCLCERLRSVDALIFDIDGVMTDGRIFWQGGQWYRMFSVQDGYGVSQLLKKGFPVAVMSGGDSADVRARMEHLRIKYLYLGQEDKCHSLARFQAEIGIEPHKMAFIGDECFDIPLLKAVGVAITVPHAPAEVRACCDYVTERAGGFGAVREVIDAFLEAHDGDYCLG